MCSPPEALTREEPYVSDPRQREVSQGILTCSANENDEADIVSPLSRRRRILWMLEVPCSTQYTLPVPSPLALHRHQPAALGYSRC